MKTKSSSGILPPVTGFIFHLDLYANVCVQFGSAMVNYILMRNEDTGFFTLVNANRLKSATTDRDKGSEVMNHAKFLYSSQMLIIAVQTKPTVVSYFDIEAACYDGNFKLTHFGLDAKLNEV